MPGVATKLLIVDDDPLIRASLTHVFHQLGVDVTSAKDGFSALKEIKANSPDVLLSDLNMPGMSGFELLSVVRRRFPQIAVIAMSGSFSGEGTQPGVAADSFYEKATRLPLLLEVFDAVKNPESMISAVVARSATPFWIPRNGHLATGESYVTISCPECLRTFAEPLPEDIGPGHETGCVHCETAIRYAIVQPTDPALPQSFQRKQSPHA